MTSPVPSEPSQRDPSTLADAAESADPDGVTESEAPSGPDAPNDPSGPDAPRGPDAQNGPGTSGGRDESGSTQWWEEIPGLPWGPRKPNRADLGCLIAIMGLGIYGLAMLPLRPLLLAAPSFVQAVVTGGSISMVRVGAESVGRGDGLWVLGLVVATLSIVKFDWIYWWAGRLWGQGLIDYLMGQRSARAQRNAARAQRITYKHATLALGLTYVPLLPIPSPIIYGALGIAGMSLRRFLIIDITFALVSRAIYLYLGWRIGEPVVVVLRQIGDYSWYLSIALLVGLVVTYVVKSRRRGRDSSGNATR